MGTEAGHPSCSPWGSEGYQRRPGHDSIHLREELLAFGLLLDGRELVIREAELPAAHLLSPGLRSRLRCRAEGLGFQESP